MWSSNWRKILGLTLLAGAGISLGPGSKGLASDYLPEAQRRTHVVAEHGYMSDDPREAQRRVNEEEAELFRKGVLPPPYVKERGSNVSILRVSSSQEHVPRAMIPELPDEAVTLEQMTGLDTMSLHRVRPMLHRFRSDCPWPLCGTPGTYDLTAPTDPAFYKLNSTLENRISWESPDDWATDPGILQFIAETTAGKTTQLEKMVALATALSQQRPFGYIQYQGAPTIKQMFYAQTGVCFDMGELLSAMGRTLGDSLIPVETLNRSHITTNGFLDGHKTTINTNFGWNGLVEVYTDEGHTTYLHDQVISIDQEVFLSGIQTRPVQIWRNVALPGGAGSIDELVLFRVECVDDSAWGMKAGVAYVPFTFPLPSAVLYEDGQGKVHAEHGDGDVPVMVSYVIANTDGPINPLSNGDPHQVQVPYATDLSYMAPYINYTASMTTPVTGITLPQWASGAMIARLPGSVNGPLTYQFKVGFMRDELNPPQLDGTQQWFASLTVQTLGDQIYLVQGTSTAPLPSPAAMVNLLVPLPGADLDNFDALKKAFK